MEISVIQARTYSTENVVPIRLNTTRIKFDLKSKEENMSLIFNSSRSITPRTIPKSNVSFLGDNITSWNSSDFFTNIGNSTESDYDYQMYNGTSVETSTWAQCKEWTPAQHTLFQTAHFFFAAAFLIPGSFKQSILIVRALLTIGSFFLTIWGGVEVCALDILLWNGLNFLLNCIYSGLLTWKFLPPTLTLELLELYMKVFNPLRVSKKHFKELVKEAKVLSLEKGDIYAVEDVSPADERLSILLKGRLRVTCDDTHLHFISVHHFVDSPEWEANHEQSDDVFQVTITAEENSVYLCWPRMKLERVLRHRPMLKTVLDALIGKDITQKLYALNEHLSGLTDERQRGKRNELWAKCHNRSMSMDAVNTGTTGLVRSHGYKSRNNSMSNGELGSLGKLQPQCWVPLVAKQFPVHSPFMKRNSSTSLKMPEPSYTPTRTRSIRREVKFNDLADK
ncbi:unnamed protein product [Brassicogethes aeneus]|uniref:POPDC1-3 domain-containing protein n=1 Tax=Brassicogethes aeneus TaxID=1431903 RepID=A0A9P0FHQ3_BRAAE|nr:unnamed protein product [Brassicogethes aeneus]